MKIHYSKRNRKVRIRISNILLILLIFCGGLIVNGVISHYEKTSKPELATQIELKNYAQTAATQGLLYLEGDAYKITDYSEQSIMIKYDAYTVIAEFNNNRLLDIAFIYRMNVFKKIGLILAGALVSGTIGIVIMTIVKKKMKK